MVLGPWLEYGPRKIALSKIAPWKIAPDPNPNPSQFYGVQFSGHHITYDQAYNFTFRQKLESFHYNPAPEIKCAIKGTFKETL